MRQHAPWIVTGAAGFVGFHTCQRLLAAGATVIGVDDLNDYYDPALKRARLSQLRSASGFRFVQLDLADDAGVDRLFAEVAPGAVVHLAAQPGVRYALLSPRTYIRSNLVGFFNVLDASHRASVDHFVYASSSSVYGANAQLPYSVHDPVDHPVSLYAATKRADELLAHSYSHLHGLPTTGLRFFTVYGAWGRPDMAYYRFAEALQRDEPILVHGDGEARRDFTHVSDVVAAITAVAQCPPPPDASSGVRPGPATSAAPFRVLNVGHGDQISVNGLIDLLEQLMGRTARRIHGPDQLGDVRATHADTTDLESIAGVTPSIGVGEGMRDFVDWYTSYHAVSA